MLRATPLFTATAALSLATGIGANATIFSAASALLLRPLPGLADPDRIVDIAIGYMGAKQLFAAARTGLFRALAEGERDVAGLASETGLSEQMARILADAMNGLGLLERRDGRYRLAPDAAAHLSGEGDLDLHPFLGFLNEISYGHWLQFDTTVDTTKPGELDMNEERWGTFMAGVMRSILPFMARLRVISSVRRRLISLVPSKMRLMRESR